MKRSFRSASLPGVITIYLSLTLILTSALIFTLIESARVSSLKAKLQSITYMAADSVFSEFAEPVFDRYGVMLLWINNEDFLKKFNGYCKENLSSGSIEGLLYTDLYQASHKESSISSVVSATDNGGAPFEEQVYEYMNYYLAEDAAERILSSISIFDQGDKVNAFMDKIEDYGEVFKKVEKSVSSLKKKIDSVKAIARDPYSLLGNALEDIDSFNDGDEGAAVSFRNNINKLSQTKKEISKGLSQIEEATDKYYECAENAKAAVDALEGELEVSSTEFDAEVLEVVSEQIEDIKQKSADTDFDYYLAGSNLEKTADHQHMLSSLDQLFESTKEPLSSENAESYKSQVEAFYNRFSGFDLSQLGVNLDTSEVEKEDDGFLSRISELFSSGLLGFIAGDVSDRSIDTSSLPSKTDMDSSSAGNDSDLLSATTDKALFGEYILQHFSNCAQGKKDDPAGDGLPKALEYETEYILAGKASDRENLSAIVGEIVLLRTGCNLISLLKSSTKKAETYALATSIAGFTGMPIVIKICQILIITAWSLAESIADVKALIEGHKIRTIKDDSDWYLSLAGIKNFGSEALFPSGSERGLSYESYLRLLLLMQNKTRQCFRTMDMIQANMCASENDAFRISGCFTGLTVNAEFSAPSLFCSLPFVSTILPYSGGAYTYSMTQKFSY